MSQWTQADVDRINAQRGAQLPAHLPPKRQKYGATRTETDGRKFDSAKEAKRYTALKVLERSGLISELKIQPWFPLMVVQLSGATENINDGKIIGTRIVCEYRADFSYKQDGRFVVEDVKSPATRTSVYVLKRAMFEAMYGVTITEV